MDARVAVATAEAGRAAAGWVGEARVAAATAEAGRAKEARVEEVRVGVAREAVEMAEGATVVAVRAAAARVAVVVTEWRWSRRVSLGAEQQAAHSEQCHGALSTHAGDEATLTHTGVSGERPSRRRR